MRCAGRPRPCPRSVADDYDLVFTAHSIPEAMAAASGPGGDAYPRQLAEAARLVAERAGRGRPWRLAYQSRSGPPSVPWLGPDVNDCLAELAEAGSAAVVLVPVGFVSDHIEVAYDLDVEAVAGRRAARPAAGAGGHPRHGPPVRRDDHRAGVRAVQRAAARGRSATSGRRWASAAPAAAGPVPPARPASGLRGDRAARRILRIHGRPAGAGHDDGRGGRAAAARPRRAGRRSWPPSRARPTW